MCSTAEVRYKNAFPNQITRGADIQLWFDYIWKRLEKGMTVQATWRIER